MEKEGNDSSQGPDLTGLFVSLLKSIYIYFNEGNGEAWKYFKLGIS